MCRRRVPPIVSPFLAVFIACSSGLAMAAEIVCPDPGVADALMCDGKPVTCVGTDENDTINGTDGDDVIHALAGDDLVFGGPPCQGF